MTCNPFKNPVMREQFYVAIHAFSIRHRDLFREGQPHKNGSSFANFFWAGYDGRIPPGAGRGFEIDRSSRQMVGYAWYRAGKAMAKADPKFAGLPYVPAGLHGAYRNRGLA